MTDRAGDIVVLIKKHIKDQLTEDERIKLTDWINESKENKDVFDELTESDALQRAMRDLYLFSQAKDESQAVPVVDLYRTKTNWFKYVAAAQVYQCHSSAHRPFYTQVTPLKYAVPVKMYAIPVFVFAFIFQQYILYT